MMKGFKQKLIKKTGSSSSNNTSSSSTSSSLNNKETGSSTTSKKHKQTATSSNITRKLSTNKPKTSKEDIKTTGPTTKINTPSTPKLASRSDVQNTPTDNDVSMSDTTPIKHERPTSASIDIPNTNGFDIPSNASDKSHKIQGNESFHNQQANIDAVFPQSSYPPLGVILDSNMKSPSRNLTMSSIKSNTSNTEVKLHKLPPFEDVIKNIWGGKEYRRLYPELCGHITSQSDVLESYNEWKSMDDDINDTIQDQRKLYNIPIKNKNIDTMTNTKPLVIQLFIDKLEQCKVLYDFSEIEETALQKQKTLYLEQLIEFVVNYRMTYPDEIYYHVVDMFKTNLFRSIPPSSNPQGEVYDPDEDEPINEIAWPHMSLVYEFFLRFIESPDFNHTSAKPYVNQSFILRLLQLFDSEDVRERDSLKTALHRIYGKFLSLRAFIRKNMANILLQMIYETEKFNGVAELLEILGSIINGFALPLKDEHKIFLIRVLIPLHKVRCLSLYHPQLAYCIVQFLEKEPLMTEEVVMGLLRYWPKINSTKEIMFLNEIEDIFEIMENSEFVKIQIPLCVQLTKCIQSLHFQVAERVLTFWNNEYFLNLIIENCDVVLPVLFPALYELTCQLEVDDTKDENADDNMDVIEDENSGYDKRIHTMENINELLIKDQDPFMLVEQAIHSGSWNKAIHAMAFKALKIFLETNYQIYEQCQRMYLEHCKKNFMILKKEENRFVDVNDDKIIYPRKNKSLNGIQASIVLRNKMREDYWSKLDEIVKNNQE